MTVLAATADQVLLDDIRRIATASAQDVSFVSSVAQAQSLWREADLVFVGQDLIAEVRSAAMPWRSQVVVVAASGAVDTTWREAMSIGAEHVVQLPDEETWLMERLAQLEIAEGKKGTVVAVVGGSGGVGCSTFVAACGAAAAALGKSPVVVDLDVFGCGLDTVMGSDEFQSGVRWSELYRVHGRIPGASLASGLPSVGGVPVLSFGEAAEQLPTTQAVAAVLESLQITYDLIFIDLPRYAAELVNVVLPRAQVVSLIVRPGVVGAVGASRTGSKILSAHSMVDLLVRHGASGRPTAIELKDLGDLLRIDPLLVIPDCKDLALELESGVAPGTSAKSKLGAMAREYVLGLDQLADGN